MTRDTYLANDIQALDALAKKFEIQKSMKLTQAYKAAEKLYGFTKLETMDEEKVYIHLTRYILFFDYIFQIEPDKKYLELMYGNSYRDAKKRHNELRLHLIARYQALTPTETITTTERATITETKPEVLNLFGSDKYISCQQLYNASACKNILIMDVRSEKEFKDSHLKGFTVINIDDALVVPGLSAHKLGEKLPPEVKEVYDKRDSFEYIILLDFDTTQDTYKTSKIRILYSMLTEWDLNTFYKHSPYILEGGYVDFIDRYPSFSTNAKMLLRGKNQELDELLDLDAIQYPDEVTTVKEDINRLNAESDSLYHELLQITTQLLKIEEQLLARYTDLYDPNNISIRGRIEAEITYLSNTKIEMNNKKRETDLKLKASSSKRSREDIQRKAELAALDYQIVNISRKIRKLKEAEKQLQDSIPPSSTITREPEPIGDRPPPPTSIPRDPPKPEIPTVDRATKPKIHRPKSENLGLVGLVNIRNTCYMSSVMQCMRHLPSIKNFFLSDKYEREITTDHPSLIYETADLIKKLSVSKNKSVNPVEFYRKVVSLNPVFKRGNHEDSNEFFMFVYDHIMEDTATPIPRDKYAEAKFQTLYDQIQYKMSYFVKTFYHQIRTDCVCGGCAKRCLKYDIENVLMMGVPERGSCSIEELYDEFMQTCDISNYFCRDCERKGDIIREFSYQPKVVVFLLKRYTYGKGYPEKITVPCDFPLDNFRIGRAIYKLWAISLHQGGMSAGHYTAVCLNSDNGIWYEFNDEYVRPVDITARHIKERSYMLFYESEEGSEQGFSDV